MTVIRLSDRAVQQDGNFVTLRASGHAHHLASLIVEYPPVDRAHALTHLARTWEEMHTLLSSGPGCLTDDDATEVLRVMASALVHPMARASLSYTLPGLQAAVRQHDQLRDGEMHPTEIECLSLDEALADASDEIDYALYALIHGLPERDACRGCRRTCASVNDWRTQRECTKHRERAL